MVQDANAHAWQWRAKEMLEVERRRRDRPRHVAQLWRGEELGHFWTFLDLCREVSPLLPHPCLHATTNRNLLEPRAHDGAWLQPVVVQQKGLLPEETLGTALLGL